MFIVVPRRSVVCTPAHSMVLQAVMHRSRTSGMACVRHRTDLLLR